MSLENGHRLGQDIEAGSHKVDVQSLMVPDNAEYPLVVVPGSLRVELNYNSHLTLGLNGAFYFRKAEYICSVIEKLELCGLVRVVYYIQKSISALRELNLAKVNRPGRQ